MSATIDNAYWLSRWQRGETGWHRDAPLPWLLKHWPSLEAPAGARVLVPLCGKSLDMVWLRAQGHPVLGVELSGDAIAQFFAEQALVPTVAQTRHGPMFSANGIDLLQADVFALDAQALQGCMAVYDRAAFFALPEDLRRLYAASVYGQLPPGCRGLLVTLEYPQTQKAGPPFSLPEAQVRRLLEPRWTVGITERRDVLAQQPAFVEEGVTRLETVIYRLAHSSV